MPNLFIIKSIAERKKILLIDVAEAVGLTPQGLHGAIKKGDIKFSYLDKIANYLQVDLSVFSDFSLVNEPQSSISVGGHNQGNIAGTNLIQVALPDSGYQKIIKSDGTTLIESSSQNSHSENNQEHFASDKIQAYLDTIKSQKDTIEAQKLVIDLLQKKK